MNYLFVVAHPDDEVLGAGAYIYKLANAGNKVGIVVMSGDAMARSNLSATLEKDSFKAREILGVSKSYNGHFPNIKMNTVPHLDLVQFVENCIVDFNADVLITHHPSDTNNDHVQTSYAVQAACRIYQRKEGFTRLKELLYMEVPSSTEWSFDSSSNRFNPNYFVEIGEQGLEKKMEALEAYKGVTRKYPHPRSAEAIKGLAAYRGVQSGCFYAEAFECVFRRD